MALLVGLAIALTAASFLLFNWWFKNRMGSRKYKSPFSLDNLSMPGLLVTDQKQRDAVLKKGFASKKVPENLDAIFIGSGIGSLSAAALVSRSGWKVLVLEQHDQAGGCCHSFEENGFEFDIGIHYIGKLLGNTEFRNYLDQITNGKLDWAKTDDNFDTVCFQNNGNVERHPILAEREHFQNELIRQFPEEEENIRKFVEKLDATRKQGIFMTLVKTVPVWLVKLLCRIGLVDLFTSYFKDSQLSVQQVVQSITSNKKLQAVFSYCFGDYGVLPSDAPWPMQSMLMTHFWQGGAAYPVGGASEIAFQIIPVIESAGGKVLVRAPVGRILLDGNGKACGVTVLKSGAEQEIRAPIVVSGAGVINTFGKFLPKEIAQKSRYFKYINDIGSGHAALQLFVGLRGTSKELDLGNRNYWCFMNEDLEGSARNYLALSAEEAAVTPVPLLFISFPGAKDPTWNQRHPGKSVATIVTLTNFDWFKVWENEQVKKRGDAYEQFKSQLQEQIWEQCLVYFPQLKDKVEYMSLGSPLTHQYYIGCSKGQMYGMDHGMSRFTLDATTELRPETDIPGLYLTGQDVLACGFSGASYGGLLCASTLLGRNLFLELVALKKEKRKLQKSI